MDVGGVADEHAFVDDLSQSVVTILDVTPALLRAGVRDGRSEEFWMPEGHYSPRTNRLVADEIARSWLSD